MNFLATFIALVIATTAGIQPQDSGATTTKAAAPLLEHPEDWTSPDTIAAAVYDIVSGDAGVSRDWDRYRALFFPGARFTTVGSVTGKPVVSMDVEGYIEAYGPSFHESGIHETEIWSRTEQHDHIASRWGTCEFRWGRAGGPPDGRCLATMQFVGDGERWWISGMTWESAPTPDSIPARYLPPVDD